MAALSRAACSGPMPNANVCQSLLENVKIDKSWYDDSGALNRVARYYIAVGFQRT